MNKISCKEAAHLGLKRYFTGAPCPKGHLCERYTNARACVLCVKETADRFKRENPLHVSSYNRSYQRVKQHEPHYKLANRLRKRLARALSGQRKSASAINLLGCPLDEAIRHIESKWLPEMSWSTWGSGEGFWQIDHIKPLQEFDLSSPAQAAVACHISNLQPLWHKDHARKSSLDSRRIRNQNMNKFRSDVAALMAGN